MIDEKVTYNIFAKIAFGESFPKLYRMFRSQCSKVFPLGIVLKSKSIACKHDISCLKQKRLRIDRINNFNNKFKEKFLHGSILRFVILIKLLRFLNCKTFWSNAI